MPEMRGGPPYAMTEMIAAEPALAERLVRRLTDEPAVRALADDLRATADAGGPIVLTGCGTSEHAAMVGAALLDDALRAAGVGDPRVASAQAFELMGRPPASGLVIGVSHEGGTWATNEALREAAEAGAKTALITVSDRSPGAAVAGRVVQTGEQDQSWCHTVGYLSPMLTVAVLAGMLRGQVPDPVAVRALLDSADHAASAEGDGAGPGPMPPPAGGRQRRRLRDRARAGAEGRGGRPPARRRASARDDPPRPPGRGRRADRPGAGPHRRRGSWRGRSWSGRRRCSARRPPSACRRRPSWLPTLATTCRWT